MLFHSRAHRCVLDLSGIRDGMRVLEVATGSGEMFRRLVRVNRSGYTVGVDLSPNMAARTQRRVHGEFPGSKAHCQAVDARNMPFRDGSFDALVKDQRTEWSGVRNPVAQRHLHAVKKGDRIFYYHTGDEKSIVGICKALGDAYPDPNDPSGKAAVVDVEPVKKLARPVTLAEIKADPSFKDFPLVRISRLSVMPVTDSEWARIEKKSG